MANQKQPKVYKLGFYRARWDKERFSEGTLEELIESHSYTLECGQAYEHERGNRKINTNPKTFKSLVDNLNKAINNSAANGYCEDFYFIPEEGQVA